MVTDVTETVTEGVLGVLGARSRLRGRGDRGHDLFALVATPTSLGVGTSSIGARKKAPTLPVEGWCYGYPVGQTGASGSSLTEVREATDAQVR